MKLPRVRFTVRRMMVGVAVAGLVLSYVVSYYQLSRRGIREAVDYGIEGVFYVPVAEAVERKATPLRHYVLAIWYAPLNWIDRKVFGTPGPADGIMWGLSG